MVMLNQKGQHRLFFIHVLHRPEHGATHASDKDDITVSHGTVYTKHSTFDGTEPFHKGEQWQL